MAGEPRVSCPIPISRYPAVTMAHGGGGRLMHGLIEGMFLKAFGGPPGAPHDGALVDAGGRRVAFTTDSYVVKPLFFPGGDIGRLAVFGTVNDLAMCGARPLALSAGLILEEGLPMETLWAVTASMAKAAGEAGVPIVTGDTKVVDRGRGDGLYVNTAGVGLVEHDRAIGPGALRPGDVVLLSGDVGRHGMAVMAVREGLKFESPIESDAAPLWGAVQKLLAATGYAAADFELVELNEAFSAQPLAVLKELGIPAEKVNVHGGAVALGHPIGCSGARILTTLVHAMRDRGARLGLAALCIGGGNAVAVSVELC